jgi:hypothetical protein
MIDLTDIANAIDDLVLAPVLHTTYAPDTYDVNGRLTLGAASTPVEVQAAVFPITGQQLMLFKEGVREEAEYYAIAKGTLIRVNDQLETQDAKFRVLDVKRWLHGGFSEVCLGKLRA